MLVKVALILSLLLPGQAWAEAANLDPKALARPGPVARAFLAQELFFQGLAAKDALALIQAARMMARVGVIPAPDRVPEASGKKLRGEAPLPRPVPDVELTLQTAEVLAQGDDLLLSLIDAARAGEALPRGAVRQAVSALAVGGTDSWTLDFFGASPAELAVLGNGQSALTIAVTDEGGAPVCAQAGTDRLYCRFVPKENGAFTVTVTNTGSAAEAYRLITN